MNLEKNFLSFDDVSIKVFVSSTIDDLPNERATAKRVIPELGCTPAMSEFTFRAEDIDSIELCMREVKQSQIFVLLLGPKYGYELNTGISICEKEYLTAVDENKPIIVFNLVSYKKDLKQTEFASRVGKKYFLKSIKDTFELEAELRASITDCINTRGQESLKQKEQIITNLVQISFPEDLFIASLNIDRDHTIKNSASTGKHLLRNASDREVAYSALKQSGVENRSSDWVINGKRLITFQNLKDTTNSLRKIIDLGTIEMHNSLEYAGTNSQNNDILKNLLHFCFQRRARSFRILWSHSEGLFFFAPLKDGEAVRTETWTKTKRSTRTVYEEKYYKGKLASRKHLAFRIRFYHFQEKWFLMILPDWFFSWTEYKKSKYAADKIKYLKRVEHNHQVLNHFEFISYILRQEKANDLFNEAWNYETIKFGENLKFDFAPKIDDMLWHKAENALDKRILLNDGISDELFIPENS